MPWGPLQQLFHCPTGVFPSHHAACQGRHNQNRCGQVCQALAMTNAEQPCQIFLADYISYMKKKKKQPVLRRAQAVTRLCAAAGPGLGSSSLMGIPTASAPETSCPSADLRPGRGWPVATPCLAFCLSFSSYSGLAVHPTSSKWPRQP